MNFEVLGITVLLLIWGIFGAIPWLAVALRRRGRGMLALLPLAAVGGIGGGLLTPALGGKDGLGLVLSPLVAVLGGLALTLAGLYFLQKLPGAVPPAHPR
jgi:hypothetical protein